MKVMGIVYMQQWALFDINNGHRLKNECTDTFYRMCQHIETKGLALCIKSVSPLKKNGGSNDSVKRFEPWQIDTH